MRNFTDSLKKCTKMWIKPFAQNKFVQDKNGNMGMIFALSSLPVLLSVGLGVDYSRATDAQSAMQSAADSAVLAAILDQSTTTCALKRPGVLKSVTATIASKGWVKYNEADISISDDPDGGCVVNFAAKIDTSIMAIAGYPTMDLGVKATAIAAPSKKIEIALALDNTGSMGEQGMKDLRDAANDFVDIMSAKTPATHLKMGIVPFVAMVNPGKDYIDNADMADYEGDADYHGYYLAGQNIEGAIDCGGYTWSATGSGGSETENKILNYNFDKNNFNGFGANFSSITQEILGVKAAHARVTVKGSKNKTAATDLPTITSTWVNHTFIVPNYEANSITDTSIIPNSDKDSRTTTIKVPLIQKIKLDADLPQSKFEFQFPKPSANANTKVSNCIFLNPEYINHFDLFQRTGPNGVQWKGCVMARSRYNGIDLDVTDSPPTSDPNTKFVPMFWLTDPASDKNSAANYKYSDPETKTSWPDTSVPVYNNAYLAPTFLKEDYITPDNTNTLRYINLNLGDHIFSFADLLRYNGTLNGMTSMPIIEDAVDTLGPNKGCPNEVTPLTDRTSDVKKAIKDLTRWNGGGTVMSEGLMWAWRVLSPHKPYAMGAGYNDTSVQKYIILMGDGANYLNEAGPQNLVAGGVAASGPIGAETTAYGTIHAGQQPLKTFAPQIVGIAPWNASAIFDKTSADKLLDERFTLACKNAKDQGIKVYTIYFSHGLNDPRAENSLKGCSGENHINAADKAGLKAAFNKIAASIYSAPRLSK
jgi:Putative Flp pilus-assembly TadE/G-like